MASFWLQACPIVASFYMAVHACNIRVYDSPILLWGCPILIWDCPIRVWDCPIRVWDSPIRVSACPDILYTRVWDCIFSYMHACLSGAGCTRSACCTYNYIGTCMQYCMDNLNVHGTVHIRVWDTMHLYIWNTSIYICI